MNVRDRVKAIPRIRPTIPLEDILLFVFNIFKSKSIGDREEIIASFEKAFTARYNLPPGIAVGRARMAFYYLLKNMKLKPGGEVIISGIHVADFINIIRLAGFIPVVVDLKKNGYLLDIDDLERKINSNTVAMLITHLFGYSNDMNAIMTVARKRNIPFIEDCSQAVSSCYGGKPLGTFGEAAIYSLSLLKPVCTINGGMIISANQKLLADIRNDIRNLPAMTIMGPLAEAFKNIVLKTITQSNLFTFVTFPLIKLTILKDDYLAKYQKTNKTVSLRASLPKTFLEKFSWQQAILGLSQLRSLKQREDKRIENGLYLYQNINNEHVTKPQGVNSQSENTFWLFPVQVNKPSQFRNYLAKHKIDCSKMLLSCVCEEEAFKGFRFDCPQAQDIKAKTIFIPGYVDLKRDQLEYVISVINEYREE